MGKERELVEEIRRYSFVGMCTTKCHGSNTVELDDGWKPFYSGVEPAKYPDFGGDTC